MKDKHFSSRMLTMSGTLMILAGIVYSVCIKAAYGGLLFPAGLCMLFSARSFRLAEDRDGQKHCDTQDGTGTGSSSKR